MRFIRIAGAWRQQVCLEQYFMIVIKEGKCITKMRDPKAPHF